MRAYGAAPQATTALLERLMGAEPREDDVSELRGGKAAAGPVEDVLRGGHYLSRSLRKWKPTLPA